MKRVDDSRPGTDGLFPLTPGDGGALHGPVTGTAGVPRPDRPGEDEPFPWDAWWIDLGGEG